MGVTFDEQQQQKLLADLPEKQQQPRQPAALSEEQEQQHERLAASPEKLQQQRHLAALPEKHEQQQQRLADSTRKQHVRRGKLPSFSSTPYISKGPIGVFNTLSDPPQQYGHDALASSTPSRKRKMSSVTPPHLPQQR